MTGTPEDKNTDTLDDLKVDTIIAEHLTKTDKGYIGLDTINVSDIKKEAINSEIRRRATEGSYTKNRQQLLEITAELEVYKGLIPATAGLSDKEQETLDDLKYSDPDEWYKQLTSATQKSTAMLTERTSEAKQKLIAADEVTRRTKVLMDFNTSNPTTPLTDDQILNDIPPRLLKQVETGELTFDDMLTKAHAFINGSKVINNPEYTEEPSFDDIPGGNKPTTTDDTFNSAYENTIY